jgi:hypothetical protein
VFQEPLRRGHLTEQDLHGLAENKLELIRQNGSALTLTCSRIGLC